MKKLLIVLLVAGLTWPSVAIAAPQSENYVIQDYSFGSGGTDLNTGSESFKLFGILGEAGGSDTSPSSITLQSQPGLLMSLQANPPATPTLENPFQFYDQLKVTLDKGVDPDNYVYAIAISNDGFTTTHYITKDFTVADELSEEDWLSFTDWGDEDGFMVTGLEAGSVYEIKVKAKQGDFTESEYSEVAEAETELPSLTFSVNGSADMGVWREENNFSSTAVSTLTTSTNAYNGYSIYAFASGPLTRQNGTETIADLDATYASPKAWLSGIGFGYTTNDVTIAGSQKWNQNPCPGDGGPPLCYAAFSHTGPGDVVADHEDNLNDGPIIDEEFVLTYKAVTQATQVAGTYSTTIVYTVVPTY